ncbi:MAG: rhodanese [Desulfobacterales bacterium CG23_combo_of_CG06-09_8_20_14_all_51_8]|nr:MAG: rhodanese [Desulfobacterales bacterium CG23_combo_of_CG06-09_8_20_14_all_51_8]
MRMTTPFTNALWQIPAIFLISAGIAFGFNQVRGKTLPLFCPWSQGVSHTASSENVSIISVDEAAALFYADQTVFIDARPESFYNQGHIRGAFSLPFQEAEEKCFEIMEKISPDKHIITYCDGATCDLCDKLAVFLCDLGCENVSALINGWTVWNQYNLPVDTPNS